VKGRSNPHPSLRGGKADAAVQSLVIFEVRSDWIATRLIGARNDRG